MTMTDPVADLLTRLRNANSAYHDTVSLPSSKLKSHIAEILQKEGYIAAWKIEDARVGQTLTIDLKYGPNREPVISGIKRVSKPGLRRYFPVDKLPRVRGGTGISILSTSRGIMSDGEARKQNVGGELMCTVY